jgi:hypothetical protein
MRSLVVDGVGSEVVRPCNERLLGSGLMAGRKGKEVPP